MSFTISLNKTKAIWISILVCLLAGLIFVAGIISGMMLNSAPPPSVSVSPKSGLPSDPAAAISTMGSLQNMLNRPLETLSGMLFAKKKTSQQETQPAVENKKSQDSKTEGDKPPASQNGKSKEPSSEKKPSTTRFWVEADSFSLKSKASDRAKELKGKGYNACILKMGESGNEWYAVQIGDFENMDDAAVSAADYKKKEGGIAVVNSMSATVFEQKKDCKGGEGG